MEKKYSEWVFKYEPKTIDEMILEKNLKDILKDIISSKKDLSLCIHGSSGIGKGTFVNIFLQDKFFMKINGSKERGIDEVREKLDKFSTTKGFNGIKYLYINESDNLTIDAQKSIRDLQEKVHDYTKYIYVCNYITGMLPELISRSKILKFSNPPGKEIFKHCMKILESENIKNINKNNLSKIILDNYPDIRKTIHQLELNCITGSMRKNIIECNTDIFRLILNKIKNKDYDEIRKILRSNMVDYQGIYNFLFDNIKEFENIGCAVVEINEGHYRNNFVANKELNFIGTLLRIELNS